MAYRAVLVSRDPLNYFLQHSDEGPYLRVSDIILRYNHSHRDVFAQFIRIATHSKWSHSALLYLINDPAQGFDNTFLVEARTKGIRVASWRNEVIPFKKFTVAIKRPKMDWYMETPHEKARHDPWDPEDVPGIAYLRHVRGVAVDQINGLYDNKVIWELTALYAERVAQRHMSNVPQIADAADAVAKMFRKWDASSEARAHVVRFICSGLVQYSFFAALRFHILRDLTIPEHREAAMHNLSNMHRVIYCEDLQEVVPRYIKQVLSGERKLADPIPDDVADLLKTATPADFNNSQNLEWRYLIVNGVVWEIHEAPDGYTPESEDEREVLELMSQEHRS